MLQNVATMSIKRRVSRGPRPAFSVRGVAPVGPRGSGESRLGECLAVQRGEGATPDASGEGRPGSRGLRREESPVKKGPAGSEREEGRIEDGRAEMWQGGYWAPAGEGWLWKRGLMRALLCQGMFEPYLKSFYIRSTDPTQIKVLKVSDGQKWCSLSASLPHTHRPTHIHRWPPQCLFLGLSPWPPQPEVFSQEASLARVRDKEGKCPLPRPVRYLPLFTYEVT